MRYSCGLAQDARDRYLAIDILQLCVVTTEDRIAKEPHGDSGRGRMQELILALSAQTNALIRTQLKLPLHQSTVVCHCELDVQNRNVRRLRNIAKPAMHRQTILVMSCCARSIA